MPQHRPVPERARLSGASYLATDTIAAPASAAGGAVALLRISGPRAFPILEAIAPQANVLLAEPRKLVRAELRDPASGGALDSAMIVRFAAPNSYTGEDVVELHLHGSPYLSARVLEVLRKLGARPALPGEFSFRAVRNGKMTLAQAQSVADLVAASNDAAVALALEKLSGTENALLEGLSAAIREITVLAEAGIDFSDQDLDEVGLGRLQSRLAPVRGQLQALAATYDRGSRIQNGIRVAFVGLPNAGKSSFFNLLLGEDRSIVSEQAGTTRDIVREHITLAGPAGTLTLRLEDTAGLRASDDTVEKLGIDRSQHAAKNADLLLLLADAEAVHKDAAHLASLAAEWQALGAPVAKTLGILTKVDLLTAAEQQAAQLACARLGPPLWVRTSAKTHEGITEATDAIVEKCHAWLDRRQGEVLLTQPEQRRAVEAALEHVTRALGASELDLFASDLRLALAALGPLIGQTLPEDILGRIFADFCIGK